MDFCGIFPTSMGCPWHFRATFHFPAVFSKGLLFSSGFVLELSNGCSVARSNGNCLFVISGVEYIALLVALELMFV